MLSTLELDHDASVFVGLIAQIANALDNFLADKIGDADDEVGAVYVVGNFRDDDLLHPGLRLLGVRLTANAHNAFAGLQITEDALASGNQSTRGEIRSFDDVAKVLHGDLRIVDNGTGGINQFIQIVRWNIRGHADSDAG